MRPYCGISKALLNLAMVFFGAAWTLSFAATTISPATRIARTLSEVVKFPESDQEITLISTDSKLAVYEIDMLSKPVLLESGFCKIVSLQYLVQVNKTSATPMPTDVSVFEVYAEPVDGKCGSKGKGYATAESLDGAGAENALFELKKILACIQTEHCAKELALVDTGRLKKLAGGLTLKNLIAFKGDGNCRVFTFLGLSLKACGSAKQVTVEAHEEPIETE